jgi:hypothetical protein
VVESPFRTLLIPLIGTALLVTTGLIATSQAAVALSVVTTFTDEKRRPALVVEANP